MRQPFLLLVCAALPAVLAALASAPAPVYEEGGRGAVRTPGVLFPSATGQPPSALAVAFSGEGRGYLSPCGCSSPMIGGFPRRSTWLATLAKRAILVRVDNGDLTQGLGRQDELKAETLVDMLGALKYDAVNVGENDLRLGVPYLQSLGSRLKGGLLCANARRQDGSALLKGSVLVTRQIGGRPLRVLIVGVLSDRFAPQITPMNPDITIEPPHVALDRLRAQMASADVRILLYHGPKAEAEQIARIFPAFQLIVCAHEGDHPIAPAVVGATTIVCSGQDGKYMGQATLTPSRRIGEVKCEELGPDLADDPNIMLLKAAYLDRVTDEDLLGKVPRSPTLNGDSYAGSEACAPCHAGPDRIWKSSVHARALETLAGVREDRDPECVVCHVVGLGRVSGFVSRERSPALASVGCESCHGAAARHVKDPKSPMVSLNKSACSGCHNPQNSPRFDFASYWPRIRH